MTTAAAIMEGCSSSASSSCCSDGRARAAAARGSARAREGAHGVFLLSEGSAAVVERKSACFFNSRFFSSSKKMKSAHQKISNRRGKNSRSTLTRKALALFSLFRSSHSPPDHSGALLVFSRHRLRDKEAKEELRRVETRARERGHRRRKNEESIHLPLFLRLSLPPFLSPAWPRRRPQSASPRPWCPTVRSTR